MINIDIFSKKETGHLVFVGSPFGDENTKQGILAQLEKSQIRDLVEFTNFLKSTYAAITSTNSDLQKTIACLNTLVTFVETLPAPVPPNDSDTLKTLKSKVEMLQDGIGKNAAMLQAYLPKIEEICYVLTRSDKIPLDERLEILYGLYDPIAHCAPGIQGQISSVYVSLTAGNLLQRVGNFAKEALCELNRGKVNGKQFDAGPHALNRDLIKAHQLGIKFLNIKELIQVGDPHGDAHSLEDINNILAKNFTVDKFIENCINECMLTLAGNIQLSMSLRDTGLNFSLNDETTKNRRRVLQAAFEHLDIDIANPKHIDGLFTSPLFNDNGTYQLLSDIDQLSAEYDELTFSKPLPANPGTCFVDITAEDVVIWYKDDPESAPRKLFGVKSNHELYKKIVTLKNQNGSLTTDIIAIINPKDNTGYSNLELNQNFIKYMTLTALIKNRIIGITDQYPYRILHDAKNVTEYTKQSISIGEELKIWAAPFESNTQIFAERSGNYINTASLSNLEKNQIRKIVAPINLTKIVRELSIKNKPKIIRYFNAFWEPIVKHHELIIISSMFLGVTLLLVIVYGALVFKNPTFEAIGKFFVENFFSTFLYKFPAPPTIINAATIEAYRAATTPTIYGVLKVVAQSIVSPILIWAAIASIFALFTGLPNLLREVFNQVRKPKTINKDIMLEKTKAFQDRPLIIAILAQDIDATKDLLLEGNISKAEIETAIILSDYCIEKNLFKKLLLEYTPQIATIEPPSIQPNSLSIENNLPVNELDPEITARLIKHFGLRIDDFSQKIKQATTANETQRRAELRVELKNIEEDLGVVLNAARTNDIAAYCEAAENFLNNSQTPDFAFDLSKGINNLTFGYNKIDQQREERVALLSEIKTLKRSLNN